MVITDDTIEQLQEQISSLEEMKKNFLNFENGVIQLDSAIYDLKELLKSCNRLNGFNVDDEIDLKILENELDKMVGLSYYSNRGGDNRITNAKVRRICNLFYKQSKENCVKYKTWREFYNIVGNRENPWINNNFYTKEGIDDIVTELLDRLGIPDLILG